MPHLEKTIGKREQYPPEDCMKCPECGFDNVRVKKFCKECGAVMPAPLPADLYVNRSSSPKSGMSFGALTPDFLDSKLEQRQDQQMKAALEANPEAAWRLRRNRMLLLAVPCVVVVIVFLILLLT